MLKRIKQKIEGKKTENSLEVWRKENIQKCFEEANEIYESEVLEEEIKLKRYQQCADKILDFLNPNIDIFILSADIFSKRDNLSKKKKINIKTRNEVEKYYKN